jgi:hypothetical protein
MTEQNPNPDVTDDTEGHGRRPRAAGTDDAEGLDSMDDDVEGHSRKPRLDISDDEDDVEGHTRKPR